MESWKGRTLGTNAPQPGDASTKLGAGGPIGKGCAPAGWRPSEMMDPPDIDYTEDYKLPVNKVEDLKNFKPVSKAQMYTLKDYQQTTTDGVTTYWKDSDSGMRTPPHG